MSLTIAIANPAYIDISFGAVSLSSKALVTVIRLTPSFSVQHLLQ